MPANESLVARFKMQFVEVYRSCEKYLWLIIALKVWILFLNACSEFFEVILQSNRRKLLDKTTQFKVIIFSKSVKRS